MSNRRQKYKSPFTGLKLRRESLRRFSSFFVNDFEYRSFFSATLTLTS
ncbi:hypothetical protein M068_2138 [Bacteroides fragilis str. J38-1]|nr:hypothetical protein M100_2108 [Bacteroides fragilis str. 1007-1-F \